MLIAITVTTLLIFLVNKGVSYVKYLDRINSIHRDEKGRFCETKRATEKRDREVQATTLPPIKVNTLNGSYLIRRN